MVTRVVVAVVGVAVFCLVGCTPFATETGRPTPPDTSPVATSSSTATPTTTPDWSGEQQAAMDAVKKWYRIYNEVMQGKRGAGDLALAGRGDIADNAARTYNDFGLAHLTVEGDVTISNLVPSKLRQQDRPTIVVDLCEDSTKWSVLDSKGNDVFELKDKIVRPLAITVEQWPVDRWFVATSQKGSASC